MDEKLAKGLEGVVVAESTIGFIDGITGRLLYRGYNIHDLALHSNFEEICFLLLFEKLPNKKELDAFKKQLISKRKLPLQLIKMLKVFSNAPPMDALRSCVSLLSHFDAKANDNSREANMKKAIDLIAKFPTIVAFHHRLRKKQKLIQPNSKLSHAANFLFMLSGKLPDKWDEKAMDLDFVLTAEHGFNASTFAVRVTASTLSDIYSGVVSGIGTLKGPLHGGARSGTMRMLRKIGSVENVDAYLKQAFERKEKIMGWGHRVYKVMDPRAIEFKKFAREFSEAKRDTAWIEMLERIEQVLRQEQYFIERNLFPNVDFYPAVTYNLMKIPDDLSDSIFAIARISGWSAHFIEQQHDNRLIRPREDYEGKDHLLYIPIGERK